MLLENYQLLGSNSPGEDSYAEGLYNLITDNGDTDETTPMLVVTVYVRLRISTRTFRETLTYEVQETQLTNLHVLLDHYVTQYETIHLSEESELGFRSAVVVCEDISAVEVMAERVTRDDETARRSRFQRGEPTRIQRNFERVENGDGYPTGLRAVPRGERPAPLPFPDPSA